MQSETMQKQMKHTKKELQKMLIVSRQDFDKYKQSQIIAYLRDASEKLFTTIQNYIEYRIGKTTRNYDQFEKEYRLMDIGMTDEQKRNFKTNLNLLHVFNRHGMEELPEHFSIEDMQEIYTDVYNKLDSLINKL